jgi:large subunit ribosomal protein L29
MAIIKKSEFNQMNEQQLTEKVSELQKELMKLRAQISTHTTLENPGRVKSVRKMIARIYTKLNQKKSANVKKTPPKPAVENQEKKKEQKTSESMAKKKTKEVVKTKK